MKSTSVLLLSVLLAVGIGTVPAATAAGPESAPAATAGTEAMTPAALRAFRQSFAKRFAERLAEAIAVSDGEAEALLKSQRPDGSWADLDYRNRFPGDNWHGRYHLEGRVERLAVAYSSPASRFYRDPAVGKAVVSGIHFWHKANPGNPNWWNNEILVPRLYGHLFLLCDAGGLVIDPKIRADLMKRWKRQSGNIYRSDAANKMCVASSVFVRALYEEDEALARAAVRELYKPYAFTVREGLQDDFTFHQHGNQLQTANYGWEWINLYSFWTDCLQGTPFDPGIRTDLLAGFALKSFFPSVRGRWFTYNAQGRHLADKPRDDARAMTLPILARMIRLDPANADRYRALRAGILADPGKAQAVPMTAYFYRSDYLLRVRPAFTFDCRTASRRVVRCEWGHRENLLGYWLGDGASGFYRRGDEYHNISPLWDWHKVPGVTNVAYDPPRGFPRPPVYWGRDSETFVGGVSAGTDAVLVRRRDRKDMPARIARFAFGDAVVLMGAGLSAEDAQHPLISTVNQCWARGKILPEAAVKDGLLPTPGSLTHDGFRYTFPEACTVRLASAHRSGNWKTVSAHFDVPADGRVFTLWIDHGIRPAAADYTYIVTPEELPVPDFGRVNAPWVQAVADPKTKTVGIVFYGGGRPLALGGHTYRASAPCVLLDTADGLFAADPAHTLKSLTVTRDGTDYTASLPSGARAGSRVRLMPQGTEK